MNEGKPRSPATPDYPLPPSVLSRSQRLLEAYDDIVRRTSAFSVEVADAVRSDPGSVATTIHQMASVTTFAFQRWSLDILYLLSLGPSLRYSQLRDLVPGITNRSLSLKLDDMEAHGLLHREVGADRSVAYSLTPRGRTFTRLSFPMVLHLSMDEGLAERLGADPRAPGPVTGVS